MDVLVDFGARRMHTGHQGSKNKTFLGVDKEMPAA
jgi:hypothetical protein